MRKERMKSSRHSSYVLGHKRDTMAGYNGKPNRKVELILQNLSQFGLWAETRPHEVGIASKRRSANCVEYVLGSCTHRLPNNGNWWHPNFGLTGRR